jgi:metal-dependent amidase/aminoacylase/carboxypeptidase family protein
MVRATSLEELGELLPRVHRCFEAGAIATGAKLEIRGGDKPCAEVIHDAGMAAIYKANAEALGRRFPNLGVMAERATGSTDMGNVSKKIPSIHPFVGIDSLPAVNHQPEFTAHCITAAADKALLDGAVAMAWTCIDMASNTELSKRLLGR